MRIVMPTGRAYEVVNGSNKENCVGTLRRVATGDASNSTAKIYVWPEEK